MADNGMIFSDVDSLVNAVSGMDPLPIDIQSASLWGSSDPVSIPVTFNKELLAEFAKPTDDKKKSAVKPNPNPTKDDLMGFDGDLGAIVPTGFALLHEDLIKYSKELFEILDKISKPGTVSNIPNSFSAGANTVGGAALKTGVGVGLAGAGVGLAGFGVSAVIKSIKGEESGETENPEVQDHYAALTNEISLGLTLDDLSDEDKEKLYSARNESFVSYVNVYYKGQVAEMAGNTFSDVIGSSIGTLFSSFWNSAIGKEAETNTFKTSANNIIAALDKSISIAKFTEEGSELTIARDNNLINYIKVYYAGQIAKLAGNTFGEVIGDSVNSMFSSMFTFSKKKEEEKNTFKEAAASVISQLDTGVDAATFVSSNSDTLDEIRDKNMVNYIKVYYAGQVAHLTAETIGDSLGTAVGSAISSLVSNTFGRLFKKKEEDTEDNSLQDSLNKIIIEVNNKTNIAELSEDKDIKNAQKDGVADYVKAYYSLQASEMNKQSTLNSLKTTGVLGKVTAIFSSIFGNKSSKVDDSIVDVLNATIIKVAEKAKPDEIADYDAVKIAQNNGIADYVKAYYNAQAASLKSPDNKESFKDKAKDFVSGLVGKWFNKDTKNKKEEDPATVLGDKLSTIISYSVNNLNVDSIIKSGVITKAQNEGITEIISNFYESQAELITDNLQVDSIATSLQLVMDIADGSGLTNADLDNTNIKDLQINSILNIAKTVIDKTETALIDNFTVEISDEVKETMASISKSYQNAVSTTLKLDTEKNPDEENIMATSEASSLNETIDKINKNLGEVVDLLKNLNDKSSNNNIVIAGGGPVEDIFEGIE